MSKLIVLLMDHDYPFTQDHLSPRQTHNTLVRQTLHTARMSRSNILAKANFLKNLKNKYLVKVDSLLQQEQSIHIMYEYVQNKLINVLKNASILLINKIYAQLNQFGRYLSNIGVRILFSIDRMGFTQKQTLKYFMGLDYQWQQDPDQQFLQQFYDKQSQQILGQYMKNQNNLIVPPSPSISSPSNDKQKQRKISYSTLPSRYNRYNKIDQKLKQLKSSPKLPDSQSTIKTQNTVKTQNINNHNNHNNNSSNKQPIKYNNHAIKKQITYTKTIQDRKYSGDIKYEVTSLSKLIQKDSDIQSQIWQRKRKVLHVRSGDQQPNPSQITNKTKSRAQEMRQKQYREISNQKKDYLKDFISVLEQEQQHNLVLPITMATSQYQHQHQNNNQNPSYMYSSVQNNNGNNNDNNKYLSKISPRSYSPDNKRLEKSTAELRQQASQAIKNKILYNEQYYYEEHGIYGHLLWL